MGGKNLLLGSPTFEQFLLLGLGNINYRKNKLDKLESFSVSLYFKKELKKMLSIKFDTSGRQYTERAHLKLWSYTELFVH